MGWFESQIEERRSADDRMIAESLRQISDAVTGREDVSATDVAAQANSAITAILGYYGVRVEGREEDGAKPAAQATSDEAPEIEELIEERLRGTGVMVRSVSLPAGWSKDAAGAMLGFADDGTPLALLPRAHGGYSFRHPKTGEVVAAEQAGGMELKRVGYCFYRPLPQRKLNVADLLAFMLRSLEPNDYLTVICATAVSTLIGLVSPLVNQLIFGPVIESGSLSLVFPVVSLLLGVSFSTIIISVVSSVTMGRISTKVGLPLQAAIMMRVLSLPASFFATVTTSELTTKISAITSVCSILQSTVLTSFLGSVFSLAYVGQIWAMAPALLAPALLSLVASTTLTVVVTLIQQRVTSKLIKLQTRVSDRQYGIINGIQKIKLAGAEKRAFAVWAKDYAAVAKLTYNGPAIVRISSTLQTAISLASTVAIYFFAVAGHVSVAEYMAFTAAFGMVSGTFGSLASAALQVAQIRPHYEVARPLFETVPESADGKQIVTSVSGGFELDNVHFGYDPAQPSVLNGISLKVRAGSYVAVVGKTGCGKSTMLRLLLGFEKPQKGAVYYDGRDLSLLDLRSLRRNIGVVLQDGKLFQGSIYDNISISAPGLSMDDAWHAAELAGVADDIRAMPMGMQTIISEGGGGVSGGQRQRLMIARAIAGKPKILMFDEATSALDNVTQRIVSESLDELKCTRLVIAHRLSTIRHCDRIVVIDHGVIVEDGTYEQLMAANGPFADLVSRQQA